MNIPQACVDMELRVRRIDRTRASGPLQPEDLSPCTLHLRLERIIEVSMAAVFPTQGDP